MKYSNNTFATLLDEELYDQILTLRCMGNMLLFRGSIYHFLDYDGTYLSIHLTTTNSSCPF